MTMDRIAASTAQKKMLKESGIRTVEELMYADLRSCGWDKYDAFYAAYRDNYVTCTKTEIDKVTRKMDKDPCISRRIKKNPEPSSGGLISAAELARETSKEKILSDLVIARKKMGEGTKEWSEITKMIGDYAKIKQDNIKTDEEPIKYFLPANMPTSCKDCIIGMNERGEIDKKCKNPL